MKRHFTPHQVAEIVQAVAGYNATNRWTDTLNIPAEENGEFFRRQAGPGTQVELDTFLTPTSDRFAGRKSAVAPLAPGDSKRPPLEPFDSLADRLKQLEGLRPALPLAGDAREPAWARLMQVFPVANKGRIATLLAAESQGRLDPRVRCMVAWTCARHDRAWHMIGHARQAAAAAGIGTEELRKWDANDPSLPEADRAVISLAAKMTAAPWTIIDADVARLRRHFTDFQVAEIVLRGCNAAYLDRLTIAAGLPGGP